MGHHPDQPTDAELEAALTATGYRYSDPVEDDAYPRITEHDPEECADAHFPEGWSAEPTERDQAAIDAGHA